MTKRLFVFIIAFWGISLSASSCAFASARDAFKETRAPEGRPRNSAEEAFGPADGVELVRLYNVVDGKLIDEVYKKRDLETSSRIRVGGYVCGIVVLCQEGVIVDIDGQELSKIRTNPDGTYSVKYFGTFRPQDLELPEPDKTYYEKAQDSNFDEPEQYYLTGGYSCFPRVVGSIIDQRNEFNLNFTSGNKRYTLPIYQMGASLIKTVSLDSTRESDELAIYYQGNNLSSFGESNQEFAERVRAIAEGIDNIEHGLGVDLVRDVVIVDYDDIYNAVTCNDQSDIWFYIRTFFQEPLAELRTIAAHETLHVYVDQMKLPEDPTLRSYFADLKGYAELSYERFILMMNGNSLAGEDEGTNNVFFSFINEKNFMENMNGGHSQKNIEEFSASFIHSLIFIDRLDQNLDRPLKVNGLDAPRFLSPWEKQVVLDQYIRGIECLLSILSYNKTYLPASVERNELFLRACLEKAENVRAERARMFHRT